MIGFIIGFFVGGFLGVLGMALCVMAKQRKYMKELEKDLYEDGKDS